MLFFVVTYIPLAVKIFDALGKDRFHFASKTISYFFDEDKISSFV